MYVYTLYSMFDFKFICRFYRKETLKGLLFDCILDPLTPNA